MAELTRELVLGLGCDFGRCEEKLMASEPASTWSRAHDLFLVDALRRGWVAHASRSLRWHCPEHAHRARLCKKPGSFSAELAESIAAGNRMRLSSACGSSHCPAHAVRRTLYDLEHPFPRLQKLVRS